MRISMPILTLVLIALSLSGQEQTSPPHGTFTGEVKPVIFVSDVEKSMPFYRDVLGFDFDGFAGEKENPYYAEMVAGMQKFGLHEPTNAGDEERVGKLKLYFRVVDVEAHRRRLTLQGVTAGKLFKRSWMDFFSVTDRDGNEIVFAETDPDRHTSHPWSREKQ